MITKPAAATDRTVDGRWVVGIVIVVFLAALTWFFLGMPGMDHSSTTGTEDMAGMEVDVTVEAAGRLTQFSAAEFDERLSDPAVTVVNVHVPYDGELSGTDAFAAFDRIVGDPAIPTDRSAPILLYCRSGRMSKIAGEALIEAGYLDVAHLDGGMDAWEATGRSIIRDPQQR